MNRITFGSCDIPITNLNLFVLLINFILECIWVFFKQNNLLVYLKCKWIIQVVSRESTCFSHLAGTLASRLAWSTSRPWSLWRHWHSSSLHNRHRTVFTYLFLFVQDLTTHCLVYSQYAFLYYNYMIDASDLKELIGPSMLIYFLCNLPLIPIIIY